MDVELILKELAENGHAAIPTFLKKETFDPVSKSALQILANPVSHTALKNRGSEVSYYHVPAHVSPIKKVQGSFLGKDPVLDQFAKELFENADFLNLLHRVVGKTFKINTFSLRQASSLSQLDGLHQDGRGQVSIAILLNDTTPSMPTTFFVPKSHRFSYDIGDSTEPLPFSLYKPFIVPCTGKGGDVCVFFNKTWHGMQPGNDTSTALLIAFDPAGFEHAPKVLPDTTEYGAPFKLAIGEKLHSYLAGNEGLVKKGDVYCVAGDPHENERLVDYCLEHPQINIRGRFLSFYMWNLSKMYRSARFIKRCLVKKSAS